MADKKNELALVPIEKYAILAESPENMQAIIADNLGTGTIGAFDLEQIRVPGGGGTLWERKSFDNPDSDDGAVHLKEIVGVVSYFRDLRQWWKLGFDEKQGAGGPPDCSSQDNIHGNGTFGKGSDGNPSGLCSQCPKAQWGSNRKGGRGQDCGQIRMLFMNDQEGLLPLNIKVPTGSYLTARKFFIHLAGKMLPYWSVIMRLGLAKDRNDAGIVYSKITFAYERVSKDAVEHLRKVHNSMEAALKNAVLEVPQDREDVTDTRSSEAAE